MIIYTDYKGNEFKEGDILCIYRIKPLFTGNIEDSKGNIIGEIENKLIWDLIGEYPIIMTDLGLRYKFECDNCVIYFIIHDNMITNNEVLCIKDVSDKKEDYVKFNKTAF